ncbi:MAG: peptide chain release factor N(5)-glutamine methyltransferase [Chloroflexi bacterium]|nr:peptide chain release factor N(5)-glutamine methyltransferase [Chloroflexota bacterium]
MMFDFIVELHQAFTQAGLDDPLKETLHLCDILSNGALRGLNGRSLHNFDLEQIIQRRQEGTPLEYILGRTVFMGRPFTCTPDTLIPRAETELLVQTVIDHSDETAPLTIVDMGTGSGNIVVSLALALPQSKLLALDISPEAIACAQAHVDQYQLQDRVTLFCGDLFEPLSNQGLENQVDIVVCNPPYIPSGSLAKMSAEIVDYEPLVALDAGPYGINIFRRLVKDALLFLHPGGLLAFEIGVGQEALVKRLLQKSGGYENVEPFTDNFGTPRVFLAQKK